MSNALKCDRCKTCFIPEESEGRMIKFKNPMIYFAADTKNPLAPTCTYLEYSSPDSMVDLCPHCTERFLLFMWKKDKIAEMTDPLMEKGGVQT